MDVILVAGFWLDGSSWGDLVPALERAGHRAYPLTLPGLESLEADRSEIGLADHVDAVVAQVDAIAAPAQVVLVGHSGGGAIAHAVADARPTRVARVIYVDSGPLSPGEAINDGLPSDDGEIPLPDWSLFDDDDLVDLTDELRSEFRARAVPQPRGVAYDRMVLRDERRYDVPATVIACEFSSALLTELIEEGHPWVAELARLRDVEYVDLPTGHWPQFTRPADLARVVLAAIDRD